VSLIAWFILAFGVWVATATFLALVIGKIAHEGDIREGIVTRDE